MVCKLRIGLILSRGTPTITGALFFAYFHFIVSLRTEPFEEDEVEKPIRYSLTEAQDLSTSIQVK